MIHNYTVMNQSQRDKHEFWCKLLSQLFSNNSEFCLVHPATGDSFESFVHKKGSFLSCDYWFKYMIQLSQCYCVVRGAWCFLCSQDDTTGFLLEISPVQKREWVTFRWHSTDTFTHNEQRTSRHIITHVCVSHEMNRSNKLKYVIS